MQGLPAAKSSTLDLARRFWAIIAILIFFASFARTWLPMIGVLGAIVLVFVVRELAWRAPAAIRSRAVYVTALLVDRRRCW